MMNYLIVKCRCLLVLLSLSCCWSCQKFIDVVPDNIAGIDNAFSVRSEAQRYLATCYSYIPNISDPNVNPAYFAGNEFWHYQPVNFYRNNVLEVAQGQLSVTNPQFNIWDNGMFQAIRDCNIFLENIGRVPDIEEYERNYWIGEVNVLKAYYHYLLMRQYGPIPNIKINLPVIAPTAETRVFRNTFDENLDYIVGIIDSNMNLLQERYISRPTEAGRITKTVAAAIKAEILLTAASPLFNGNMDYASLVDAKGTKLMNTEFSIAKWEKAAEAYKDAIAYAETIGENKMYTYSLEAVQRVIPDSLKFELNIRNAYTSNLNPEIVWAKTNSFVYQSAGQTKVDKGRASVFVAQSLAPTLEAAELFYSNHGVPITEDKTFDYANRYELKKAVFKDRYYIREGEEAAKVHFDREPRYYGSIGFDRGVWYGNGRYSESNAANYFYVQSRAYEVGGRTRIDAFSITGMFAKKIVSPESVIEQNSYSQKRYLAPIYRMSALYLAYAEALNEVNGPTAEVYALLDKIRSKYGLPGVKEAWANYSKNPNKPDTKEGLRAIIQQERMIELMFEGQNFWDIRRWNIANTMYTKATRGFNIVKISAKDYNVPQILNNRIYSFRENFWPIKEESIIRNRNLVQNPGW
ncbi:RagB/SusD family nutrient uptake outer membrane protein [Sphingobacterium sp. CZ-UAM]|uniref:RagB/SusD family nutrient uptake outer membrane protein n=1 Tax=Sphingobacterium sp. CZ-UAM TaxID=1933868 RepID=UPI00158A29A3|nr:RagB/SusD family nutrient uptake outer membrane protein [Sphingobacterium sp. CZ-UAM]